MKSILNATSNYRSLSIKDLLLARDQYHYHLINKANVVGTAIGLYLIRDSDPYPEQDSSGNKSKQKGKAVDKTERTLFNSHIRDYSWPCVLVFVDTWVETSEFGDKNGELHPDEFVPRTLYMPDGRMVPVCIVKVSQAEPVPSVISSWHWPETQFGGGMPIRVETQAQARFATAGCLVTDGHTVFALTSRHVCGGAGEMVFTGSESSPIAIGRSSGRSLTRVPFEEIYPEFSGRRTYVNMDVGLVELNDTNEVTSQIFGLGEVGAIADLNEVNTTLRLIDANVVASGAASGVIMGKIKGLFYRFKTAGGFDYVADFLIAPRETDSGNAVAQTQPGDSGAIWHLILPSEDTGAASASASVDPRRAVAEGRVRPIAVQWGGQVVTDAAAANRHAFALATNLSAVCRELDVELVLQHNIGARPYWGQTGHYSIAALAESAVGDVELKGFIQKNIDRISFDLTELTPKGITQALKNGGFVPLADVPDVVWKQHFSKLDGGRDDKWAGAGRSTGPEHPTHFADIDEPDADGKTLRELCIEDEDRISVAYWQSFYDKLGHTQQNKRGLLPFRVWQFFDAMVDFLENSDVEGFLCAAGILSHYVGDACQPLHGSMLADGYADRPMTITHPVSGKVEKTHEGAGVHSTYESNMIDRYSSEIVADLPGVLKKLIKGGEEIREIQSGKDAAAETIKLMDRSATAIPPADLVDAYIAAGGKKTVAVQDALWTQFGTETKQVMADGARVLAAIWDGAWAAGGGPSISKKLLKAIGTDRLTALYTNTEFVKSLDLDSVSTELKTPV